VQVVAWTDRHTDLKTSSSEISWCVAPLLTMLKQVRVIPMVQKLSSTRKYACREIVTTHSTPTASAAS
jgi:hypothetical protein